MKWQFGLAALALIRVAVARGLKTSKVQEGSYAPDNQLMAENEALKRRNKHLEAMMQVARNEVHRMDVKFQSRGQHPEAECKCNAGPEVLQKRLQAAEADKKSLMQTLRKMLAKNSTKIINNAVQAQHDLEVKFGNERLALQAQIKDDKGALEEAKEMGQTLQEQNLDLQRTVHDLKEQLAKAKQTSQEFAVDKMNLVETMHGLMRDNNIIKAQLQTEAKKETKLLHDLAVDEAKLANLTKKNNLPKVKVAQKASGKHMKHTPLHMNHQESAAVQNAKMTAMNRYIDRANMPEIPSDDDDTPEQVVATPAAPKDDWRSVNKQVDALAKQEDILARSNHNHAKDNPQDVADAAALTDRSKGLGDWLGLKAAAAKPVEGGIPRDANGLSPIDALDPDAVKQEKAAEAKKAKADADDGGDGIEGLLSQAKEQLNAMDAAEAQNAL